MTDLLRLHQKIQQANQELAERDERLSRLRLQHTNETRDEEKLRLEKARDTENAEITALEQQLQQYETELKSLWPVQREQILTQARDMERNGAYKEALAVWRLAQQHDADHSDIDREIARLEARFAQADKTQDYLVKLAMRAADIGPIYADIITRLKQLKPGEGIELLAQIDVFLSGALPADSFITVWQALTAQQDDTPVEEPQYAGIADKLKLGELVLFLGASIPWLFDIDAPLKLAAERLAEKDDDLRDIHSALSAIAEYYDIVHNRRRLLRELHELLPDTPPTVPLYDMLADIRQPLVIISTNYDTWLEHAFQRAGKRYVVISTLLRDVPPNHSIGQLLIRYSDQPGAEKICDEQLLSGSEPLKDGYSLIYKIRGYFDPTTDDPDSPLQNALMLSETNYFDFARHMETLIPRYVLKQFNNRGCLFLGYSAEYWEDRLLAGAILDRHRRYNQYGGVDVIHNKLNSLESAFWRGRGGQRYALELPRFVERLREALSQRD